MARHIGTGGYLLIQNSKTVGELRVVTGSGGVDVVEQWLLYTSLGAGADENAGVYSRPSATNTSVNLTLQATSLSWSDPEERQNALSQEDIEAEYIRGECTTPSTVAPPAMSGNRSSQIDVGWYAIYQGSDLVGQVVVADVNAPTETLETWYLYTAVPSGEQSPPVGIYTTPNSTNGGAYRIDYLDSEPPLSSATGFEASCVEASCVSS